jgi:hypothetical protein
MLAKRTNEFPTPKPYSLDTVQSLDVCVPFVLQLGPLELGQCQPLSFLPQSHYDAALRRFPATSAVYHMTFLGTQPTLTQVPPSRGLTSTKPTLAPYNPARRCRRKRDQLLIIPTIRNRVDSQLKRYHRFHLRYRMQHTLQPPRRASYREVACRWAGCC